MNHRPRLGFLRLLLHAGSHECQVIATKYPPLPGYQQCAGVPDRYKSQCIAGIDSQRAAALVEAQNVYNFAYGSCMSSCRP